MGAGEFILTIFVSFVAGFLFGLVVDGKAEKYVKENLLSARRHKNG